MSWHNAPNLNKLTASQQGGKRGAQLWGVDFKGTLYTIYQETPGGGWSKWLGPDWAGPGYPKQVYELAAAQMKGGRVHFWAVDMKRQLWTTWQHEPGGDWAGWHGPGWNSLMPSVKFKDVAATQRGDGRGTQFLGLSEESILVGCHQRTDIDGWSPWGDFAKTPEQSRWVKVTAARQGGARAALWGLDDKHQLWGMGEASPGSWGTWSGPNWLGAPRLRNIAAAEEGGKHGARLWGITEEYRIISNAQTAPDSNNWGGWSSGDWFNAPRCYELAAAGQNNGCLQLWAITLNHVLTSIRQTSPGVWENAWSDRDAKH